MRQRSLISSKAILPKAEYEKLFENLPPLPLKYPGRGRLQVCREADEIVAMIREVIARNDPDSLRKLKLFISDIL